MRRATVLLLAALAACSQPKVVKPALWEVTGANGEQAWLLGTIHALPEPVNWRSAEVDRALNGSDRLLLEVAAIGDGTATRAVFQRLASSPGLPPLVQRLPPQARPALQRILADQGADPAQLDGLETWAATLSLNQLLADTDNAANGIDRAILRAAPGKRIDEFEGAERQFAIFDTLPEADQRAMLLATVSGAADAGAETARLAVMWSNGEVAGMAEATRSGLLADPELRQALLTGRNQAWATSLQQRLRKGERPLVAVGAAHLVGPEGLPALLAAQGWTVRRIQ